MDVICQKHPALSPPNSAALLKLDPLPQLKYIEITGSHILYSACNIHGGHGPGGCDFAIGRTDCFGVVLILKTLLCCYFSYLLAGEYYCFLE